ncbi:MAG: hypothetical protein KIT34_17825 [Cyanobacteria bacterium TGS_CYA1]|nr:hypothetical protein [Cyanobacteria bacterium TGS_CYA1]
MTKTASYTIEHPQNGSTSDLAALVYDLACRTDFSKPGFALVRQRHVFDSKKHREELVALKEALSSLHQSKTGFKLGWFTMSRFDQKNTTKLHRDGGPSQSLLILGYEPSTVKSQISMADYSQSAFKLGITPEELLDRHNPMYEEGKDLLDPFTHVLNDFDTSIFQILVVNNSNATFGDGWQGVLHGAVVEFESSDASRVINSTSVCPMQLDEVEEVSGERVLQFLQEDSFGVYK